MIRIQGLEVRRKDKVICRVSELEVTAGERVAIVGPNGSGKSTLLMVLAGLDATARGRCDVAAPLRDRVYVHQQPFLFQGTVLANTIYGLKAHGMSGMSARKLAGEWLERFGVAHFSEQIARKLSGGERRRVALARSFALRPKLLLLDEPLADLDDDGAELLSMALTDLEQTTVLIAAPTDVGADLAARTHSMKRA